MRFLLLLAIFSCLSIRFSSQAIVKIPLRGHTTPDAGRYGTPVTNHYTEIGIGSPAKLFKVQFDTNHPNLWIPHYENWKINPYLHFSDGFRCSKSTTCKKLTKDIVFSYNEARLKTELMDDQVALVGMHLPTRMKFGAVTQCNNVNYYNLPIDGIFGLAPSMTTFNGFPSPLVSLQQSKAIDLLKFGLWFDRTGTQGELTIGGDNPDRYVGPQQWITSMVPNLWSFRMISVSLGNNYMGCTNKPCRVDIASGTSEIYGDKASVNQIYRNLGAQVQNGVPIVNCQLQYSASPIIFNIENVAYQFPATNYIKPLDSSRCFVTIFEHPDSMTWSLGTNFLSSYYTSFDVTRRMMSISGIRN